MLDAILIAGLVTAVVTPVLVLIADCMKRVTIKLAGLQPPPENTALSEAMPVPDQAKTDLADQPDSECVRRNSDTNCFVFDDGVVHDVPADVAEIVISDFRPGTDSCRVWLRSSDYKIDQWTSAAGAVLALHDAAEWLTITFQGLNCLPFENIETVIDCPRNGRQLTPLPVPSDGDSSNDHIEVHVDAEWRLAAWAETERAVEAFDDPEKFAIAEDYGRNLPTFTGFNADAECIEVWIPGATDADAPVEVLPTHDGHHGLVMVAGRPTAVLQGAPFASARNIRLVPMTSRAA